MIQCILPGFRRYLGPEPRIAWTDGKGNAVKVDWQTPKFYGRIVPIPHDKRGAEIRIGPLRVLQRTDDRYFVYDERLEINCNSRYLAARGRAGLLEAIGKMIDYAREEGLPIPPMPRKRR